MPSTLPTIPLDPALLKIGDSAKDTNGVAVAKITPFGSQRSVDLKFGEYLVLDDLETILKKGRKGLPDQYVAHITASLVVATASVSPMQCQTTLKIWQRVKGKEGFVGCGAIVPGAKVVAFDGSTVTVPKLKKGDRATLYLGDTPFVVDLHLGIFVGEFPNPSLVSTPAFLLSAVAAGVNACQAEFLQHHLITYAEMMMVKLPAVLNGKGSFENLTDFFNAVRVPLHARYCYFRSTRAQKRLHPPDNEHTRFYRALVQHIYPTAPKEDIDEMVFFFGFASQSNDGRQPRIDGMREKIRAYLIENEKYGMITFTVSKLLMVVGESVVAVVTGELWELANVFTCVSLTIQTQPLTV